MALEWARLLLQQQGRRSGSPAAQHHSALAMRTNAKTL